MNRDELKGELREILLESLTIEVDASQENVRVTIKLDGEMIAYGDDYITH